MTPPRACDKCPVWQQSLFRDVGSELTEWLAERKLGRTFEKGESLFAQGQTVGGIYCHHEGLSKVVQTDTAGRVRFMRLVLPGDTSGHRSIFIETTYKGTASSISSHVGACYIHKQDILYLLANSAPFARNLVTKIATELKRTEDDTISIREKQVRNRLAQLIYRLCDDYADTLDDKRFLIRSEITKKDIASLLMVADETVIRLMSELKADGIIGYMKKQILVLDYAKLRKLAKTRDHGA